MSVCCLGTCNVLYIKWTTAIGQVNSRRLNNDFSGAHITGAVTVQAVFKSLNFIQILHKT